MQRIVRKLVIIGMLYLGFAHGLDWWFLPKYWEQPIYNAKYDQVVKNIDSYDTYFFGSSLTYRHIDIPRLNKELGISGYNMGTPGVLQEEKLVLLNEFLDVLPRTRKINVFLEGERFSTLDYEKIKSIQVVYYINTTVLSNVLIRAVRENKIDQLFYFTLGYFRKIFKIGYLPQLLERRSLYKSIPKRLSHNGSGFLSLEEEDATDPQAAGMKRRKALFVKQGFIDGENRKIDKEVRIIPAVKIKSKFRDYLNVDFYYINGNPVELETSNYFDSAHYNDKGVAIYNAALISAYQAYFR